MVAKFIKQTTEHFGLPIALPYSTSSFPKRSNQFDQVSRPSYQLAGMREHGELHHECAISEIQTGGNDSPVPQQVNCK